MAGIPIKYRTKDFQNSTYKICSVFTFSMFKLLSPFGGIHKLKAISRKFTLLRGWTKKFACISSNRSPLFCFGLYTTESYQTKPMQIFQSTPLNRVNFRDMAFKQEEIIKKKPRNLRTYATFNADFRTKLKQNPTQTRAPIDLNLRGGCRRYFLLKNKVANNNTLF